LPLTALTVDHRLRPESWGEAAAVGRLCATLAVRHEILVRRGPAPRNRFHETLRRERLDLLTAWCRANGAAVLLLGHHLDDQAETLLMRLDRDTGMDGLAGILPFTRRDGVRLLRPLLGVAKSRLVATCLARGAGWAEDPSNRDPRFARARLRAEAEDLAGRGLDPRRLGRLAGVSARLRAVMDRAVAAFLAEHGFAHEAGFLALRSAAFGALPTAMRSLVLARLLAVVAPGYPPRRASLGRLVTRLVDASGPVRATIGRCLVHWEPDGRLLIAREPRFNAAPIAVSPGRTVRWDGRFEVTNGGDRPLIVAALGEKGWHRLRRLDRDAAALANDLGIPQSVRASLPCVRDLDGRCLVPHLGGVVGESGADLSTAAIRFAPDAAWWHVARDERKTSGGPVEGDLGGRPQRALPGHRSRRIDMRRDA
jgi:tRNA(Ile)-lysidine synthase